MITCIKVNTPSETGGFTRYEVRVNNNLVGLIEKGKDTRSTKTPWKCYKMVANKYKMVATFFENEGGKEAAKNFFKN